MTTRIIQRSATTDMAFPRFSYLANPVVKHDCSSMMSLAYLFTKPGCVLISKGIPPELMKSILVAEKVRVVGRFRCFQVIFVLQQGSFFYIIMGGSRYLLFDNPATPFSFAALTPHLYNL